MGSDLWFAGRYGMNIKINTHTHTHLSDLPLFVQTNIGLIFEAWRQQGYAICGCSILGQSHRQKSSFSNIIIDKFHPNFPKKKTTLESLHCIHAPLKISENRTQKMSQKKENFFFGFAGTTSHYMTISIDDYGCIIEFSVFDCNVVPN